ncbi:MAG: DUF255 domain-containing protein [Bacteroidetes bacterium]|nr:MAG: DUF255 domain-containing protein [Bacteroidota bacterium]
MKKIIVLFLTLFLVMNWGYAQMKFEEGKWDDIVEKAKKNKKYIFVDAYAEWCSPCKAMAKNVFTDAKVGEFFNEKYINYKFDMEKGEGPKFAQKYGVQAYPTLLFFNEKGEMAHRAVGGRDSNGFVELGKNALNPDKQILSLQEKFEKGEKSKEFMKKYFAALQEAGDESRIPDISITYLQNIPESKWIEEDNADYLMHASRKNQKITDMVLTNRNKIMKWDMGANRYNTILFNSILEEISAIFQAKDSVKYESLKKNNEKKFPNDSKKINARLDVFYARYVQGKGFNEKLDIYGNTYCDDWVELIDFANMYGQGEDKEVLTKALVFAEKAERLEKNPTTLYAVANLLKRLDKKEQAKQKATKGLELAKKTKHTLEKNLEDLLAQLK